MQHKFSDYTAEQQQHILNHFLNKKKFIFSWR